MGVTGFCRIAIVIFAVISVSEAFRLRARFPRPQGKDFGHHAKRHVCRYCNYETRTIRQKASDPLTSGELNSDLYLHLYC